MTSAGTTVMITGANTGIGKEVARQLGLRADVAQVFLACRNEVKAHNARADLERATGRHIFQIVTMDLSDLHSVQSGIDHLGQLHGPIDSAMLTGGRDQRASNRFNSPRRASPRSSPPMSSAMSPLQKG